MHVSVIIPCYNGARTLAGAVSSVLAQSHAELEVILVDDGSVDETLTVMRTFQSDPRVTVVHSDVNHGVSYSRNLGVCTAKYDWVALLDSDDQWAPDKLEKQLLAAKRHPECGLFFTGSAFMDESGVRSGYVLHVPHTVTYHQLLRQNVISCSSVLVKKDLLLAHPFPDVSEIHEDYAVWLQILQDIPFACGVDAPLLVYRVYAASKSGNKLHAARMQWNTYRCLHIPFWTAASSFFCYTVRSLKKYLHIFKQFGG
ncbi:MAG: glycosyltransferase family 2 protein [Clostridiales bacterium]|nr:glycosyltransferase family 2 protein [Clostridiales bacterium]